VFLDYPCDVFKLLKDENTVSKNTKPSELI
jgi:hypothetical protein